MPHAAQIEVAPPEVHFSGRVPAKKPDPATSPTNDRLPESDINLDLIADD